MDVTIYSTHNAIRNIRFFTKWVDKLDNKVLFVNN